MKIVFMGTPDFAAKALEAIVEAGHDVVAVVTQPDKEKGRGKSIAITPVKECALKYNIPVLQPVRLRKPEAIEELKKYPADMYVVAAFGQILSQEVLDIPKYGCINIHASLLPAYRGAAPIQWAIIDGLKETGVTIMQMDAGIDTGDILLQEKLVIEDSDTGESLFDKLSVLGAQAIVKAIPLIEKGEIVAVKQQEELSNYAKMLTKNMGSIDWSLDSEQLERLVRGLNSWPSAFTTIDGKQLKVWKAEVVADEATGCEPGTVVATGCEPGTVVATGKSGIDVKCGKDILRLTEVQLEGKKRMDASAFLLGYKVETGSRLG